MEDIDDESHARLTASIAALDKTQHIKAPVRSEPTHSTGEFDLLKTNRLDVGAVVKVLENLSGHVDIGKTLKKTQAPEKVLAKPLEKPQSERIKRSSAFEATKKNLQKWDAVVARNRTVDYVSFPLKTATNKLVPTEEFLSKFKLKSDLERELDEVDGRQPVQEEEEEEYPMTYEEMLQHRQQLAKLRAQQSFKAAKAKRQSKIKSKKYHRILKKERMKQQLAEFEALQKTDPEEALRKLEDLEKSRALERHTLRHKNTGKWAKSKLVRAKYNTEVRQQLADQLAVSRSLTQKVQNDDSSDDQSEEAENIPDITVPHDPMNPWMLKKSGKCNEEFDFGYKKYIRSRNDEINEIDSDETETNSETTNKNKSKTEDMNEVQSLTEEFEEVKKIDLIAEESKNNILNSNVISTALWEVDIINEPTKISCIKETDTKLSEDFDAFEYDINKKVTKKLQQMRNEIENMKTKKSDSKKRKLQDENDNLSKLEFKSKKNKPIIDEILNETTAKNPVLETHPNKSLKDLTTNATTTTGNEVTDVDLNKFINVKPKYLASAVSKDNDGFDDLDDEQVVPKVNIEEVFEEDDIVDSFRQEKEEEINKDKPEDIDLSLPGWGSWGGKGVKPLKKKKSRFIIKAPPKLQRRDDNKGDIIIKEFKDPKVTSHKVSELPFPFTSVKDFESSIRAPLGNTFVPEIAHKKLIKPGVFTKAGTIISPMDDEELIRARNLTFKNKSIIKLLGNK